MTEIKEEIKPAITQEDLQRMEALTREIAAFREQLAPMTELIVKALTEMSEEHWNAINTLMQFEGKDAVKFMVKHDNKPFEVVFKSKRC